MNDDTRFDDPGFEARLETEMGRAVAVVQPDSEAALRAVHSAQRPQKIGRRGTTHRLLAVAAAVMVLGGGAALLTQLRDGSEEILVGPAGETTTSVTASGSTVAEPPDETDAPTTTIQVAGPETVLASAIPAVVSPLTGGDAVIVAWELRTVSTLDDPFTFVEIYTDSGEVLSADTEAGPYDRRFDSTLFLRREVLSTATSGREWRSQMLAVGGLVDEGASRAEQDDRLWDDSWDLLHSTTLSSEQRQFLLEMLELELEVSYRILPAEGSGGQELEIRWDGHSELSPRALYVDLATGVPVRYLVGDLDGADEPSTVITYDVARISVADLDIVPTPPAEEPGASELAVILDGAGFLAVDPEGVATLVEFGTPRDEVIELLVGSFGEPSTATEGTLCGRGLTDAVGWGSFGLSIDAGTDQVVGWTVNSSGPSPVITTADGLGLESTVADLITAQPGIVIEESTLGWESMGAPITWLVTGPSDADTVGAFWAGETCVFR